MADLSIFEQQAIEILINKSNLTSYEATLLKILLEKQTFTN